MTRIRLLRAHRPLWAVAGAVALATACSDSNDPVAATVVKETPWQHQEVVLRDVNGDALPADSREPYSPRTTCGRCHDVDAIAEGYHFQQGRVDATGRIVTSLQQPWQPNVAVLSPAMFGKW